MGVDHGGQGDTSPRIWSRAGTIMQIVPRRFCHISKKMSVLWPSKNAKIRFRPRLCPEPRWGSSRRSPRPPSRLKRGHASPYPTPLGTNPPSAPLCVPHRIPARSTPMIGTNNWSRNLASNLWRRFLDRVSGTLDIMDSTSKRYTEPTKIDRPTTAMENCSKIYLVFKLLAIFLFKNTTNIALKVEVAKGQGLMSPTF